MEGMIWGVVAMVVKDLVKQPYLKGRDYQRNVRQVYRDVDNLNIAMDHVKANCKPEDMETGPYAPFIKRAARQLRDAYRTMDEVYPLRPSTSRLVEYSSKPGGEMHLLDIGKEANQTARGLNDLLSEIRFAKIGGSKEEDSSEGQGSDKEGVSQSSPQPAPYPTAYDMLFAENASSSGSSAGPRTMYSDQSSLFDHTIIRPSSIHSPSSDSSQSDRRRSSSARHRRHSSARKPPSSWNNSRPLGSISEGDRERALDNLQYGIDQVLDAADEEHESEAMGYLEHALMQVVRLQKTQGFTGCWADEDLGDAVEDLDYAMVSLVGAKSEREKKHGLKRLSHALEDVDIALLERQRHKKRDPGCRQHRSASKSKSSSPTGRALNQPPTSSSMKRRQSAHGKSRRYSMH